MTPEFNGWCCGTESKGFRRETDVRRLCTRRAVQRKSPKLCGTGSPALCVSFCRSFTYCSSHAALVGKVNTGKASTAPTTARKSASVFRLMVVLCKIRERSLASKYCWGPTVPMPFFALFTIVLNDVPKSRAKFAAAERADGTSPFLALLCCAWRSPASYYLVLCDALPTLLSQVQQTAVTGCSSGDRGAVGSLWSCLAHTHTPKRLYTFQDFLYSTINELLPLRTHQKRNHGEPAGVASDSVQSSTNSALPLCKRYTRSQRFKSLCEQDLVLASLQRTAPLGN